MSQHVRESFRGKLALVADPTPFFETVSRPLDLNTVPDLWVTLEFPPVTAERVALGYPACMRETGAVVVHVLARSGVGDSAAFSLADSLIPTFEQPYLNDIRLTGCQPPTLAPVDNGEWIDVFIQVGYSWDYVVQRVTA